MGQAVRKLIEVALPLEKINAEAAREKSIRHGHPSTLHLWWARRPLAAARAVIWASLVDDPSSHTEKFPTEEAQNEERQRLFKILEELVVWENSNNEEVLNEAKAEIKKSVGDETIKLLDPFAGGGAIPLEAQRLGLEAHAHDLNPVAVMINKAMIEIPPRFANLPPVNPEYRKNRLDFSPAPAGLPPFQGGKSREAGQGGVVDVADISCAAAKENHGLGSTPRSCSATPTPLKGGCEWRGAAGLAEDVRYYGEWLKNEAYKKIGHLYPKVKVPKEQGGGEATVIAWIWARTVKCPNPACGVMMPLVNSWELSKKKGKEAWIEPSIDNGEQPAGLPPFQGGKPREAGQGGVAKKITYTVKTQGKKPAPVKIGKGVFRCAICGETTKGDYIRGQFQQKKNGADLMAIVAEGKNGRIYISPSEEQFAASQVAMPAAYPDADMNTKTTDLVSGRGYGITKWHELFTNRQLTALTTFSDLIAEAQAKAENDAKAAGMNDDVIPLADGGKGAKAYGEAIGVYLAFLVNQLANHETTICSWNAPNEQMRNTFARQAIPMVWDYAECNPFSNSSGSFHSLFERFRKAFSTLGMKSQGRARQFDAQSDNSYRDVVISTDPPYYDNIGYADLSDFFYVWLRQSLKDIYPELFKTLLVPKNEELIASPYRHDGSKAAAKEFFENGMLAACRQFYKYSRNDTPVTIYYAYKEDDMENEASGWETMLSSIIKSGFAITGTWPMRTEKPGRMIEIGTNALASSIVLVCRKRDENAPTTTRRNFINELKRSLPDALTKLQKSNIATVDFTQSAIGPGMAIFSKYKQVLEADGSPMTVRSALQLINQEVEAFLDGIVAELDRDSRFCVELYTQCAFNDVKNSVADELARAKNALTATMIRKGILYEQKGVAHLIVREELPAKVKEREETIWLLAQQLTRAMEKGGVAACADIIAPMLGANVEQAKALAYRLYTIAEKKGWAAEAYAYNSLVASWPDIQSRAAQIAETTPVQTGLFENEE